MESFMNWFYRWRASLAIGILVVATDLYTKYLAAEHLMVWTHAADTHLYQGSRKQILQLGDGGGLGSYFSVNVNYVRNHGAAWGSLKVIPENIRFASFYVLTLAAIFGIIHFSKDLGNDRQVALVSRGAVIGGILGNFFDRVTRGFVVDWIDMRWQLFGWRQAFPNFNVADIIIAVGVIYVVYDLIRYPTNTEDATRPNVAAIS
jgi:lipoprotein signal peptidase